MSETDRIAAALRECFGAKTCIDAILPLAGDASTRRYVRARLSGAEAPPTAVVMILADSGMSISSEELAVFKEPLKEQLFVQAIGHLGGGHLRILGRHILPNAMPPIIVYATLGMGTAVLQAAALGFLGLGAQPPQPEWGAMLSEGRQYIQNAPHVAAFPGAAILLLVLGFNLFGDGLRDVLDPSLRSV